MLFCKIGSHVWPLKDVGLFSLLHTSLDLVNKKGITVRTVLMFTSEANAIMDRHTGNVISKELL